MVNETKIVKTSNNWKVAPQKLHKIRISGKTSVSMLCLSPAKERSEKTVSVNKPIKHAVQTNENARYTGTLL